MLHPGYNVMIAGCDSINLKKIKLYKDEYPDVRLFFCDKFTGCCDLCVMPADKLPEYFQSTSYNSLAGPSLVAFGAEVAMPASLAAGCDDYICEPWGPLEFYERVRRCFRLSAVEAGGFHLVGLCCRKLRLVSGETVLQEVSLAQSEYEIFRLFSCNRGSFFDRESLSQFLNVESAGDFSRSVDMHVSRLRIKINRLLSGVGGTPADNPIATSTGRGWGFNR